MLVHASYLPYPPQLLKDAAEAPDIERTRAAYETIRAELYASQPDYVIFIGKPTQDFGSFQVSVSDVMRINLSELGNFAQHKPFEGTKKFTHALQESFAEHDMTIRLIDQPLLPTGVSLAAYGLFNNTFHPAIGVISYADADSDAHWTAGTLLREVIESRTERVALIGVGNLSHCVYQRKRLFASQAGYEFDAAVQEALQMQSPEKLRYLKESLVVKARECGLKQLLVVLGALEDHHVTPEILAYEHPLGVGYLSVLFHIR